MRCRSATSLPKTASSSCGLSTLTCPMPSPSSMLGASPTRPPPLPGPNVLPMTPATSSGAAIGDPFQCRSLPSGHQGPSYPRRHGRLQPDRLAPAGAFPKARRSQGADRSPLRGCASGGAIRPAEGSRLECVGQRGRVPLYSVISDLIIPDLFCWF